MKRELVELSHSHFPSATVNTTTGRGAVTRNHPSYLEPELLLVAHFPSLPTDPTHPADKFALFVALTSSSLTCFVSENIMPEFALQFSPPPPLPVSFGVIVVYSDHQSADMEVFNFF